MVLRKKLSKIMKLRCIKHLLVCVNVLSPVNLLHPYYSMMQILLCYYLHIKAQKRHSKLGSCANKVKKSWDQQQWSWPLAWSGYLENEYCGRYRKRSLLFRDRTILEEEGVRILSLANWSWLQWWRDFEGAIACVWQAGRTCGYQRAHQQR